MTHFIAIADQDRDAYELFAGDDLDAAFAAAATSFGDTFAGDATVEDNSTGYRRIWLREVDNRQFWVTVMAHEFAKNDNRDWFLGEDEAAVRKEAEVFLGHEGNNE
jgi:hypothetical protein